MSSCNKSALSGRPGSRHLARHAGRVHGWLLGSLGLVSLLLVLAAGFGLPLLAGQKARLETLLSDQLSAPVRIETLNLGWQKTGPRLHAEQVTVGVAATRPAGRVPDAGEPAAASGPLQIQEIQLDIDLLDTLWTRVLRVRELSLVGVDLVVEHAPGEMPRLRGLALGRSGSSPVESDERPDGPARDPFGALLASPSATRLQRMLGQARLALIDTRVTLADVSSGTQLQIDPVDIRAGWQDGSFRLDADLRFPHFSQSRLSVAVAVDEPIDDGERRLPGGLGASVEVDIQAMELDDWNALLAPYLATQPVAGALLDRLDASIDARLQGRWEIDRLRHLGGRLMVRNLDDTQGLVALPGQLAANLDFQPTEHGWRLSADELEIDSREHQSRVDSLLIERRGGETARWQLDASGESLALADAAALASLAPGRLQTWLLAARPAGTLQGWRTELQLEGGTPLLSLNGQLENLRAGAAAGLPAFDGLEGALAIEQNAGDVTLRGRGAQLSHALFDVPLTPDVLIADLSVDFSRPGTGWLQGSVVLDDRALRSRSELEITLPAGDAPHIDLHTQFSLAAIEQSIDYLPVGRLPPAAAGWLKRALRGGRATNGELELFGRLADFPFDTGPGAFRVGFDVRDGQLDFLPGWPLATAIDGRVELDGASIVARASQGRLDAMQVSRAEVRIDNLRRARLAFSGTGAGELQALVDFANDGPLARWLRPALVDVRSTGQAQMDIALNVPLHARPVTAADSAAERGDGHELAFEGALFLAGNTLYFERADIELADAQGAVSFDNSGIHLSNLKTRFLDRPVLVSGRTDGSGRERATVLSASGAMAMEPVLERYGLPLQRFVQGTSKWRVNLRIPYDAAVVQRDGLQLELNSDLVGTRLDLPAPLRKYSGAASVFSLSAALREGQAATLWHLGLDDQLRMHFLADSQGQGLQSMRVRFGTGAGLTGVPEPLADGIDIAGAVDELGFDGWVQSIATLIEELPAGGEPAPILPVTLDLQVGSLLAGSTPMGAAQLSAYSDAGYLHASIDNASLRASVEYPREYWRRELTLQSRVAFADMRFFEALGSSADVAGSDDAGTAGLDPRMLPAIEARVSRFRWDQLDLQDVALRLSPVTAGLAIDSIGFAYRNTQLSGSGYWHIDQSTDSGSGAALSHISGLALSLVSDDFGSDLNRLGYPGVLDEGQGRITAALDWQGPVYLPELASLAGDVSIDLAAGRILGVNPGAARMVGLFALQALPRRLNLDFKDIIRDGLDFETLRGDIRLNRGVASTDLLQFNGPVGVIDVTGSTSIVDETYAQRLTILPRVSAALPVIGLISAGASGGIGALVAGGFLKAIGVDFDRLGLREYRLEGTWDDPVFTSVGFVASTTE